MKVYYTDIRDWKEEDLFARGLARVNELRRAKVLACKKEDARARSLAAGLLIRYACEEAGFSYDTVNFSRTETGKPCADAFYYGVTHSGDCAAVALGDAPVGIDVERFLGRFSGARGENRFFSVVGRTFDEEERALVGHLCADGGLTGGALLQAAEIWTKKESFAKECGRGLAMDFSAIHTLAEDGFRTYKLPEEYILSVFTANPAGIEFPVCVNGREMLG